MLPVVQRCACFNWARVGFLHGVCYDGMLCLWEKNSADNMPTFELLVSSAARSQLRAFQLLVLSCQRGAGWHKELRGTQPALLMDSPYHVALHKKL